MIDTIAALSTAQGPGAIGILRISGPKCKSIASQFLYKNNTPLTETYLSQRKRSAIYCDFLVQGKSYDKIVALYFESPNSYTGEDLLELHFHGNPILLKDALQALFLAGCRPAVQGEFTKRAYLNGKSSLSQAEAIGRLIESRSRFELELAQKNVFGSISQLCSKLRSDLISLKAECEAEIDFSTEDLTFESIEQRKQRIQNVRDLCEKLILDSKIAESLILKSTVVLFGAPNTGKSSLMNRLIGKDRSIISDVPGTTRDYIAEELFLDGMPIRLVDTAGIRQTEDQIEKLGIERSEREAASANLRLVLLDSSLPWKIEMIESLALKDGDECILIANKIDQRHPTWTEDIFNFLETKFQTVQISCKSGEGLEVLLHILKEKLQESESKEDLVLLEDRQMYHFQKISEHLTQTIQHIDHQTPAEIYIEEINDAIREVGEVNGHVENEEILGRIFSKFCVGK
ncbi:tRNA modification GTPase TrmE [Leptospira ryugenii]|uniref:tRNA modification GTPase MnmE n=1 Tax=Leptospira ryugenii TaxID=1917863 RepID=A0A2P2E2I8_9LEPT|nr:tRNA uridine-5-carboxymethylaminomethyl(34) synthesis GTPase MnmE [Leptospira ryugenii]GBF51080.1 tRNA modification GTPase TrmE [Leptospira ryugenii]